ncbi:MAG: transglycosylase SLT domain-containing protein [Bacteroidota bacterium]|nr:transglycosylase SLT domain-containing protein [Bacteroidota bacterium]
MKINIALVIFIVIFCWFNPSFAQDFESDDSPMQMIPVDKIPEPAPLFIEDNVEAPHKDSVQARLKKIEKTIPLSFNQTIYSFIHYFTVRNREYSRMVLRRKDAYFPIFEKILKENNMPDELKYLSIVESGLNPRAKSRAGAVGLWQFVSNTGKYYKLNIDWYFDERSDPEKSTKAACEYLRYLHDMFGNWELALAAYNCGPGNVRKAIKASRNKRDFWEIYYNLPRETRSYVPQFIAISYLMNYSNEHNLFADYYESIHNTHTIYADQYINLDQLAKQLDICPEDLQKLNPTLIRNRVPAYAVNFPVKIPAEKVHILMSNYCAIMDSCSKMGSEELIESINPFSERSKYRNSVTHIVKKGEVLGAIARKYKVTSTEIMAWNNLKSKTLKYGQKLTVWRDGVQQNTDKVDTQIAFKPGKKNVYKVQPGDTLWSICQKMDVPVSKLKKLNKLKSNELKAGMKLIIS